MSLARERRAVLTRTVLEEVLRPALERLRRFTDDERLDGARAEEAALERRPAAPVLRALHDDHELRAVRRHDTAVVGSPDAHEVRVVEIDLLAVGGALHDLRLDGDDVRRGDDAL